MFESSKGGWKKAHEFLKGTHPQCISFVDAYEGTLTPKATSNNQRAGKIINYRGVSIYRFQNNKMAETWHVIDGLPPSGF